MNVNVVENTGTTLNVTLPAAPEGHGELSDDELANAAGGNTDCGFCGRGFNTEGIKLIAN